MALTYISVNFGLQFNGRTQEALGMPKSTKQQEDWKAKIQRQRITFPEENVGVVSEDAKQQNTDDVGGY